MIKIDCNFDLWKNENKRSLDFWIKVCCENVFVILLLFACFLFFGIIRLKLELSEQEGKSVGISRWRWITTKTVNLN